MKNFFDRVKYGSILMMLTGFGILFIGAVPVVTLFGGFPENSKIGDGLASVGISFIIGIIMYIVLFFYSLSHWL